MPAVRASSSRNALHASYRAEPELPRPKNHPNLRPAEAGIAEFDLDAFRRQASISAAIWVRMV